MTTRIQRRMRRLACACLFSLSLSADAFAADAVGHAEKLRGEAHIQRAGADLPVTVGTAFAQRDRVQTGAGARLKIAFADGSSLTLAENSAIEITRYAVNSGAGSRNVALTALGGLVNVAASKSGESNFNYQVRTAQGYSAVRGTNWVVNAGAAASSFYVIEGLVEVGAGGGSRVVVDAGKSVTIDSKGGTSPVQPIPPDLMKQVLDATDVASANAAPDAAPTAPTTTTTTEPEQSPAETPAAPAAPKTRDKPGGGGNSGHSHM